MNQVRKGLPPSPEEQKENIKNLAAMAEGYRKKNDDIQAEQSGRVQICTMEDMKIIVRQALRLATQALERVKRLEERLEQQNAERVERSKVQS